jgi:hypothetical protein
MVPADRSQFMRRALPFLILSALACPARAEFSIDSADDSGAATAATAANPAPSPVSIHRARKRLKPNLPSSPRLSPSQGQALASGFGAQVPLAFAIRQMAPDGFDVILEPPADPKALVDWRGGRLWTQVLADSVEPLGLAVSLHDKTVTISRPATR